MITLGDHSPTCLIHGEGTEPRWRCTCGVRSNPPARVPVEDEIGYDSGRFLTVFPTPKPRLTTPSEAMVDAVGTVRAYELTNGVTLRRAA
jgi:hypothetical protein